jgi:hypothetical protein
MLKRLGRLVVVAVSLAILAAWCQAANFSADTVTQQGKMTMPGKVYVQGKKMRQEMSMGTEKTIVILRPDKKVVWMIQPARKTYVEMKMTGKGDFSPTRSLDELRKRAVEKKLGNETVNGLVCEKRRFVFKDKKLGSVTQWYSKEIEYPVKVVTAGGPFPVVTECKNIKRGAPATSLFELPRGYKKVAMPGRAGMPGMRGGPGMKGAPGRPK